MNCLKAIVLLLGLTLPAKAASFYDFRVYHSTSTGISTGTIGGYINVANSSSTVGTPTITLDGQRGGVTVGSWLATVIGAAYGGSGANLSSAAQGALPFFHATGVMSALAAGTSGYILKSQGAAADVAWVNPASITAGLATAIAGGVANQFVYQTGAGTTGFLGPLTNGQLLIGNTGNPPTAATITGTANEITSTPGAGTITLSGAGDNATCSGTQAYLGATYSHGVAHGGTCTSVAVGSVAYPNLGYNYLISSSSGVAAFVTANNTFETAPLTYMYGGVVYTVGSAQWTVVDSSSTIITADATGLHQWGLLSFTAASISSYTASAFTDSLIVAVSTAGSGHDAHLFYPTNTYPGQSVAFTNAGRGSNINSMTVTSGAQPPVWWNCGASKNVFSTCVTGAPEIKPMSAARGELGGYSSGGESGQAEAFIVNNASGGTATIAFTNYSAGTCVVSVKGAGLTQIPASTNSTSISLGTGYQSLIIACSGEGLTSWNLPANVVFVRPGYI